MKSTCWILAIIGFLFWAYPAQAGNVATEQTVKTHTVRPGETLSHIGLIYKVQWPKIQAANQIKNPNRIKPGQVLLIPASKSNNQKVSRRAKRTTYPYVQPDLNPVGQDADPALYIQNMKVPHEVRAQFLAFALGEKPDTIAYVTKANNPKLPQGAKGFSKLSAMGYGKKGKVVENVEVLFDILRKAWYWSFDFEGKRYYLICDQKCYNWSFAVETIAAPKVIRTKPQKEIRTRPPQAQAPAAPVPAAPAPTPAPVPVASVPLPSVPSVPASPSLTEIAPPAADLALPEPAEPLVEQAVPQLKYHHWDPTLEAWIYGGIEFGIQSGNKHDQGWYAGGSLTPFVDKWVVAGADYCLGPAIQGVWWGGDSGNVAYEGDFLVIGGELQRLTGTTKTQVKVMFGPKDGEVYGHGFPYYAHETADLNVVEAAHQWWNTDTHIQNEVGFRLELASNNDKYSTWNGQPIPRHEDPALNQSVYTMRAKRTWWINDPLVNPTLEVNVGYREFDHNFMAQIRPGVKLLKQTIEPSVHYGWVEGPKNDVAGINLNVNLYKSVVEVYDFLTRE
jgi:hypothetical protein